MVYVLTFFFSSMLIALSYRVNTRWIKHAIIGISLLLSCILAALRATTIGTDIQVYAKPLFEVAMNSNNFIAFFKSSWMGSWRWIFVDEFEIGFSLVTYFSAKIFQSFQLYLFIIQCLITFPIYYAIKNSINEKYHWLSISVFYFTFFNVSLNLMRQSIAIALGLWGFSILKSKNYKKSLFLIILSTLFHNSAVIFIPLMILHWYLYKDSKIKRIRLSDTHYISTIIFKIFLIGVTTFIFIVNFNLIGNIFSLIGLGKYSHYFWGVYTFQINQIILRIPIITLFIIFLYKNPHKDKKYYFYLLLFILDLFFSQLGELNEYSYRISQYLFVFNIIYLPWLAYNSKNAKLLSNIILILFIVIYWYYNFYFLGRTETVPFEFFQ